MCSLAFFKKPPCLGKSTIFFEDFGKQILNPNGSNQAIEMIISFENRDSTRLKYSITPAELLKRAKLQNRKESRTLARKSSQCHQTQFHQHNAPLRVLYDIVEY